MSSGMKYSNFLLFRRKATAIWELFLKWLILGWPRAEAHLLATRSVQYRQRPALHQEVNRHTDFHYDQGNQWRRYILKSFIFQATARSAPEREREISNLVRKAEFSNDPFAHEFGIAINPQMTEVKGRVLSAPKLLYGGRTKATALPNQGVWDMRGKQFHTGIDVKVRYSNSAERRYWLFYEDLKDIFF